MELPNTLFLLSFFLLLHQITFGQNKEDNIEYLDQYIEESRKLWEVPGLAVTIVKDGEVLLSKGYGKKAATSNELVDHETLFVNASTTKAMTALAIGLLVDEGVVNWEDPVIQHMPEFQLFDPYATQQLRVKDLLTHNAGLGNADFLWVNNDLTSEEILHQMRYLPPSYPFRGGYTYQNIMYLAAGKLIEKLSNQEWSDFMVERIFRPLGMTRTFPLLAIAKSKSNQSTPHDFINGELTPIQDTDADAIGPAGSVWSCAKDMGIWMNFLLNDTKIDGKPLLKPATLQMLLRPQIIIPYDRFYLSKKFTQPHWTTYALGWFQHDYQGRFISFHTGSLAGRVAILGLIPDERLGVFVYGNLDGAEVRHAIMYKVFDVLGQEDPQFDWSQALKEAYAESSWQNEENWNNFISSQVQNTQPSKPLVNYTGIYEDVFFGRIEVRLIKDELVLNISSKMELNLKHWHYDTFLGSYNRPWYQPTVVQFSMNDSGKIKELELQNRKYRKVSKRD